MKKKLILLLPLLFIGLGALVIWDFYDRGLLDSSENYPEEKAFLHKTSPYYRFDVFILDMGYVYLTIPNQI